VSQTAFEGLYELLEAAAVRRHFHLASREAFLDWSVAGLAAGHTVYLAVLDPDDTLLGGATFYRHGGRLTYSHSGDRADLRRQHPGVVRLILWRAIQLAIRDGLGEVDFAGVDVAGARRVPHDGEEMYGLYAFKRSFGAEWVELAGNHERVVRPWRYLVGRLTGRVASTMGRR
jgi:peptidoglycan pentaglycine glycine transferase (the first glycine)